MSNPSDIQENRESHTKRSRRTRKPRTASRFLVAGALAALLAAPALHAVPMQDDGKKGPKKPEVTREEGLGAPPLPGYGVMFVLALFVIGLSLWSSKRTQLDT